MKNIKEFIIYIVGYLVYLTLGSVVAIIPEHLNSLILGLIVGIVLNFIAYVVSIRLVVVPLLKNKLQFQNTFSLLSLFLNWVGYTFLFTIFGMFPIYLTGIVLKQLELQENHLVIIGVLCTIWLFILGLLIYKEAIRTLAKTKINKNSMEPPDHKPLEQDELST